MTLEIKKFIRKNDPESKCCRVFYRASTERDLNLAVSALSNNISLFNWMSLKEVQLGSRS